MAEWTGEAQRLMARDTQSHVSHEPGSHGNAGRLGVSRGRVLIVDDELPVLRAYSRVLAADHHVTTACGGMDAIALFDEGERFDLVVCDIMMPEVDGIAVYDHVRARHPEILGAFVFCSGGVLSSELQNRLATLPNRFIEKPIVPALLKQLAREFAVAGTPGSRGSE